MREKETDEFSDTGFDQLVNSKNGEEEMIDENYDEEQMNLLLDGAESGQEVEEGELVENESENKSANTIVNSSTQQRKSVFCPPSYPTKGFQFNMFNATSNGPIDFGGGMDVSLLSNNSSANTSGSGMLMANSPAMTAAEALRFHGPKNGQRPPIKPYTRIIDTVMPTTTKTKAFMDSFVPVKHQAARQKQIQMLRQQRDDKATKKADEGFDKQSSSHATASPIDGRGIGKKNGAAGHSRPAVQTASSHIPPRSPCFSQPNGGRRRLSDDFIEESASAMYCQQKRPRTDQSQPASEQFQQRSIRQAQEEELLEDHSERGGSISAGAIRNSSSSDCSVVVLEQEEIKEERNAAMSPVEIGLGDEDQSGQENQAMQDRAEGVGSRNDPENEQQQNWLYYDHNFVRQWGFKGNEEDRAIVWVSGLRKGVVDGAFLHTHFSKFGAVRRIWLHNKPCVVAFVQFSTIKEAERAVADSDGRSLLGMCLHCGMDDEAEEYVVKKEECAERKSAAMSLPSTPKVKYANKNREEDHSYCRQQSVSHARQQRQHYVPNDNGVYMRNQNRFNTAARGQPRGGDRVAPTRKNPTRREGSGFFFNIGPDEPSNHVNAVQSSRHHHHSPSPPRRLSRRDLFDTERSYRSRSMYLPARFQSRHESPSPPRVSGRLPKHQQHRSYHHGESREEEEEQAHNSRARFGNGIQRKRFF